MPIRFFLVRKLKSWFMLFNVHVIIEPFYRFLLHLAYLSKISKWVHSHPKIEFNDFYSSNWNYNKRFGLYEYILRKENLSTDICYLEFGVAEGHSFKWWVEHNQNSQTQFHGFDTFEGLPEDWGVFKAGDMSTDSKFPDIQDSRVTFHKGLFQKTLPGFIQQKEWNQRKVIHMDADLYSSTLYVLTMLAPYLKKDDIVLFDEYTVPRHEFLAFKNFVESYYLEFELIAAANNYFFCAFKLK